MKKYLIILLSLTITIQISAQCLTGHYHQEAKKQHNNIEEIEETFFNSVTPTSNNKRATKYIIPVVFHVIHTNGPENISLEQIENQIKILNEDFSYTNANRSNIRSQFTGVAADIEIEFRLAKIDPQGNCTDGVNRVYSPLHVEARDNVKFISGARWDNRKYLNIWTVSSIKNQGGAVGTTLGFAYLPSAVQAGMSNYDGIVVRSDYVGVIGTGSVTGAGRTLTHEIGHYLGLLHTFEDECSGTGSNNGDRCLDTPPVSGTFVNANCPSNGNSCNSDFPDLIDQWENYMDYSSGSCQAMFTKNQKSIMHTVLTNYTFRVSLVSNNNLIGTGVIPGAVAPVAYFRSSAREVCVGQAVSFYDISCKGQVANKQWSFTGASITSTNKDTPTVTYSLPGTYKVSLMVSNNLGNNTLSIDDYITVRPSAAVDKPTVSQGFESPTWNIATGWSIWQVGTTAYLKDSTVGFKSESSLVAQIESTTPIGQKFQLVTPAVDLRSLAGKQPKLSMMLSYVRQNTNSAEALRLYYSRDCDENWTQYFFRNAMTMSYSSGAFSPTWKPSLESHWKQISSSLIQFENDSNIRFMVEVESSQGNPVYIDAINIGQFNTGVEDINNITDLSIYPNPSDNILNISFNNSENATTEIWLENIEGKRVAIIMNATNTNGPIEIKWNRENDIINGIYILKIKSNEQIINKKVIFAN
jgi:PKD repeat protein